MSKIIVRRDRGRRVEWSFEGSPAVVASCSDGGKEDTNKPYRFKNSDSKPWRGHFAGRLGIYEWSSKEEAVSFIDRNLAEMHGTDVKGIRVYEEEWFVEEMERISEEGGTEALLSFLDLFDREPRKCDRCGERKPMDDTTKCSSCKLVQCRECWEPCKCA